MKKKTYWLLAAAMTIAGCASDSDLNGGDDSAAEAAVAVSATRAATAAETESLAEGETFRLINKTRQEKGKSTKCDAVYKVGADGKALPKNATDYVVWQTGIFSQGNRITQNEFQAVIPATADYESYTLPTDQSDADKLKSADWQTATCRHNLANAADGITLNFEHQYAKLHFDVTLKDDAKDATLTDVTILDEITPYINENTIEAIISPTQPYTTLIKLEIAGETLTAPIPTDITFEPGKQYNFTLAVGHDAATISAVTVTDWTTSAINTEDEAVKKPEKPYLTFTADAEQGFKMTATGSNSADIIKKLEYSVGDGTWTNMTDLPTDGVTFGGSKGALKLRGMAENGTAIDYYNFCKIEFTKRNVKVQCTGDIRNLQNYTNYKNVNTGTFCYLFQGCKALETAPKLPATTLANYCYYSMFDGCEALTTAPELPATTLANYCYGYMFDGCKSLTTAPQLPATELRSNCYADMFNGCTALKTAPKLPATTLAEYCYDNMFYGCTALTEAPELPATTLANYCYKEMFRECKSLTKAPVLPATTLAKECYGYMFQGCKSLTTAPQLPATTLDESCYNAMFYLCTSLTKAPELNATKLAKSCYNAMFNNCTSLTTAPELPAEKLEESCYAGMFLGCTSLTKAPELNATVLASSCYNRMFNGCTSLTKAPELPATTLATSCYYSMFEGCKALKSVTMLAPADVVKTIPTCFEYWLSGNAGQNATPTLTLHSKEVYEELKKTANCLPTKWRSTSDGGNATIIYIQNN